MTDSLPKGLNDFLFAPIAEDSNGMHLTMLSMLARSGVDPWAEGARLRALSRDDAKASLVHMLGGVPNGPTVGDDTASLAARLVVLLHSLPKASPAPAAASAVDRGEVQPLRAIPTLPRGTRLTLYSLVVLILVIAGYRTLAGKETQNSDGRDDRQTQQQAG
jgi:hypothetical protein